MDENGIVLHYNRLCNQRIEILQIPIINELHLEPSGLLEPYCQEPVQKPVQSSAHSQNLMEVEGEDHVAIKPEIAIHPEIEATMAEYLVDKVEKENDASFDVVRLAEGLCQII